MIDGIPTWCLFFLFMVLMATRMPVQQLVQPNTTHHRITVCPKKYAHGFVVLCFVVVMQSFIMNSNEVFIHIHQGCFAGTGAIVRLPECQWSKPDGYGKISQCITTTKHSKAKTVCIFLGIYCTSTINGYHWSPAYSTCKESVMLKAFPWHHAIMPWAIITQPRGKMYSGP